MLQEELKKLKGKISFNVPMKRYTTMRVGGSAQAVYCPESINSLAECMQLSRKHNTPILAIGKGSNIIVKDRPVKKIFIRLSSPGFKRIEICKTDVVCGAGASLASLCNFTEKNLLGGCEFLTGIPGTVGGAIAQNAGAQGNSISDIIKDIRYMDKQGKVRILKREDIDFSYRESGLDDYIIIGATFSLKKTDTRRIRNKTGRYIEKRLLTQDYTAPSAGCVFKNPKNARLTAAQMIDRCGLKGRMIGGACVSKKHANFIINKNKADAKDILSLIALIKKKVKMNFGVQLEEEVKILQ